MSDKIVTRSVPFEVTRTEDADGDGLTLEGYAAVFDQPTRIDSWEGRFDETIQRGAFKKTLSERTPVLQFDHGQHPLVGSLPIGTISTLREDDRGLFVRARLSSNWLVEPVRDAIADGAITGMSIRMKVTQDDWNTADDIPTRTVKEVKLHELGPVVFPAYQGTEVGVRSNLSSLLKDETVQKELARLLAFGTADEPEAADEGTSVDEPATLRHLSNVQKRERTRVLNRLKGFMPNEEN